MKFKIHFGEQYLKNGVIVMIALVSNIVNKILLLLLLNTAFGLNHFNFYVHEPTPMFILFKGLVKIPAMVLQWSHEGCKKR